LELYIVIAALTGANQKTAKKRYIPAVKYQPCSYPFAKCFSVEITGFNIESLEKIAGMILEANKDLANNLTK